jgi:hypothetical protein
MVKERLDLYYSRTFSEDEKGRNDRKEVRQANTLALSAAAD